MPAVLLVTFTTTALALAASNVATSDLGLQRTDRWEKQALAAAQAGLQDYAHKLYTDPEYYLRCGVDPVPEYIRDLDENSNDASNWRQVLGLQPAYPVISQYTIQLVPAGNHPSCHEYTSGSTTYKPKDTMTDTTNMSVPSFMIRVTGRAGEPNSAPNSWTRRTVVAQFRMRTYSDFAYFTDIETPHPIWYRYPADTNIGDLSSTPVHDEAFAWANCNRYFRDGRNNETGCAEYTFTGSDQANGPFHTNDAIRRLSNPTFGTAAKDRIEVSDPTCWARSAAKNGDCHNNMGGGLKGTLYTGSKSPIMTLPDNFEGLKYWAALDTDGNTDPATDRWVFQGSTEFEFFDNGKFRYRQAYSNNAWTTAVLKEDTSTPGQESAVDNGVIYVENMPGCPADSFDPKQPEPYYGPLGATGATYSNTGPANETSPGYVYGATVPQQPCGTALVSGTYDGQLTIAAESDIVITRNLIRDTQNNQSDPNAVLGLAAKKFVRTRRQDYGAPDCPAPAIQRPTSVDAVVMAATGSYAADKFWCATDNPTAITFNGAYMQKWRGPFGKAFECSGACSEDTGYSSRVFNYDYRLDTLSPPHFVHPTRVGWRIQRVREQVPAYCPLIPVTNCTR